MAEVVQMIGRMTADEYVAERTRLHGLYGDSRKEAGARFEQALSRLFYRSGWTQDELAKQEGKSRQWIQSRLQFGRFLDFATTVANPEKPLLGLTERRFRFFWEQTDRSETNGRIRFREVLRLMQQEAESPKKPRRDKSTGRAIAAQFADGKWREAEVIAKLSGVPLDEVRGILQNMISCRTFDVTCERKPVARTHHYRIFPQDRQISTVELAEKLAEPLARLKEQGAANMATMSPPTVAYWTAMIQKQLNEWSGRPARKIPLKAR